MDDDIKRWTAKRKTALILDIIQGKTTVAEASRAYDLPPSEIEEWVEEGKKGMENALRTEAHLLDMNKNTVQRVFQIMGWQVRKRPVGFRPRIQAQALAVQAAMMPCILCHPHRVHLCCTSSLNPPIN